MYWHEWRKEGTPIYGGPIPTCTKILGAGREMRVVHLSLGIKVDWWLAENIKNNKHFGERSQ